jgi:hypothetical protein
MLLNINKTCTVTQYAFRNTILVITLRYDMLRYISSGYTVPQIRFNDMNIKYKYEPKCLGLHLAENTKWGVHIKHLYLKLNKIM